MALRHIFNLNGSILALAVCLISTPALALEEINFSITQLSGSTIDYNNGVIKKRNLEHSSSLSINVRENTATLDTGVTTLTNGSAIAIADQVTFTFQTKMALWVVTCYPKINFAFVSVHSDASQLGGARMVSYQGVCRARKT